MSTQRLKFAVGSIRLEYKLTFQIIPANLDFLNQALFQIMFLCLDYQHISRYIKVKKMQ